MFKKGDSDAVAVIERESTNLERLSSMSAFTVQDDFTSTMSSNVSKIHVYLRENGRTFPMDIYSRASALLDTIDVFIRGAVSTTGLTVRQRPQLRLFLEERIPGVLAGYVELNEAQRTDDVTMALAEALASLQSGVDDLVRLVDEGSIYESTRYRSYAQQLTERTSADTQDASLVELMSDG